MCDCDARRGRGWLGWDAGLSAASGPGRAGARRLVAEGSGAVGPWHDLSHPMHADMPRVPFFPRPVFERVWSLPEKPINVTRMEMIVHTGTHLDSPRHFYDDGPGMDEIPVDRMNGPGLVWPVRVPHATEIGPAELEGAGELLEPGDILVLDTGSHREVGTPAYEDHPWLSLEAARWIAERGVKLLAVDMPTPDCAVRHRKPDFDYPVHHHLLARGVLVAEHLTNLAPLSGKRVEVVCSALNIRGSDGAPARILAREIATSARPAG